MPLGSRPPVCSSEVKPFLHHFQPYYRERHPSIWHPIQKLDDKLSYNCIPASVRNTRNTRLRVKGWRVRQDDILWRGFICCGKYPRWRVCCLQRLSVIENQGAHSHWLCIRVPVRRVRGKNQGVYIAKDKTLYTAVLSILLDAYLTDPVYAGDWIFVKACDLLLASTQARGRSKNPCYHGQEVWVKQQVQVV